MHGEGAEQRILRQSHGVAPVAVGEHDHTGTGIGVPHHVQDEPGKTAAVRDDPAAVQVFTHEEAERVAARDELPGAIGSRLEGGDVDLMDALQLAP